MGKAAIFNFTPHQITQLTEQAKDIVEDLIQLSFSDPTEDQRTIRRFIYLQGWLQCLVSLKEDRFDVPDPVMPVDVQANQDAAEKRKPDFNPESDLSGLQF